MSLYLKYRPSDFTNLVGQSFVKNTLQKAIEENKTVGAYLLCGPRGTGKTSTARIFAKTINCKNPNKGNPCLKCSICLDFANERLIDIIEIDAASYTGVDNIREIIEKAQFSPTQTKYKVYIIDEVHMLSKGAFNALLKILEEPPAHVKFILATTETHKVPETIISRCQRYDFKRISDEDIRNRLGYIAQSENIKTDEKAINYIIKNSSGGLRNAISLFEQLIFNGEINYEKIVEQLEIVDENVIDDFLNKLLNKDKTIIEIFDKSISDGKNIKLFFKELLFHTKNRSLHLLKTNSDISKHINILEILDETYSKTKNSLDENTTFLIGVLRIINGSNNQLGSKTEKTNSLLNSLALQGKEAAEQVKPLFGILSPSQEKDAAVKNEEKIELSANDLNDVFGNELGEKVITKAEIIEEEPEKVLGNFNTNTFISKLKDRGAKGGLTMALRGSILNTDGDTLMIGAYTKIAKDQVENVENIILMRRILAEMGFTNPKIIFNLKKGS